MGNKAAFCRRHLAAWRDSGLSQAAYCRGQDVSLPCFGYWRGKLDTVPARSAQALLMIVLSGMSRSAERIEVDRPNGLRVHLSVDMDAAQWLPMIGVLVACVLTSFAAVL